MASSAIAAVRCRDCWKPYPNNLSKCPHCQTQTKIEADSASSIPTYKEFRSNDEWLAEWHQTFDSLTDEESMTAEAMGVNPAELQLQKRIQIIMGILMETRRMLADVSNADIQKSDTP